MSTYQLLLQFVFRLTFGVSLAMSATSPRWVSSGFFRVHLWVLMGLNTLASLTIYTQRETLGTRLNNTSIVLAMAIGLAVASYIGSILWLYEKARAGKVVLLAVMLGSLAGAWLATESPESPNFTLAAFEALDIISSGMLIGSTLAAMFLGHWYLNSPTMNLLPLKRLVMLMAAAVIMRSLVSGAGLALHAQAASNLEGVFWIFVALRWLSGLVATFVLAVMTWYSLKIPNTQSATGILYAGVILTFIGELTSQFLSMDAQYPL